MEGETRVVATTAFVEALGVTVVDVDEQQCRGSCAKYDAANRRAYLCRHLEPARRDLAMDRLLARLHVAS